MSSHEQHPPHTVSRYPHNTWMKGELFCSSRSVPHGRNVHRSGQALDGLSCRRKEWAPRRGIKNPPAAATPWRPEHRRGTWRRGLLDRPPGVWGERPVGEKVVRAHGTAPRRARAAHTSACACAEPAPDGARKIRRYVDFPIPSPHSPPLPLRRPGEIGRAVLLPEKLPARIILPAARFGK
jgi:hypothetical protein